MTENHLAFYLFGTPRIFIDNEPFDFRLRKGKALLSILAVEEGANSRDYLATLLWPDYDQVRARTNLRRTLSRINQTQFSKWLTADNEYIELNPGKDDFIDVKEFSRLVQDDTIDALQRAVDLYQEDFLRGFYLGDNQQFEDWSVVNQEFYRRKMLESMESLVDLYIDQQNYTSAITVAYRQLDLDKLRESAWRQLMKVQAMDGHRVEALGNYEKLEGILEKELGVPPSPETLRLYQSILEGNFRFDKRIHGYVLEEKIGDGNVGFVYRAFQPTVERTVAIKEIHPIYANQPEFIRHFEAEAQLIASLEHPHIAPIYDYWREPDRAFIVMRFFGGGNLKDRLKKGPYKPADAERLIDQVASGLILAHRQGIIHRNLKPSNILIDEQGDAYLSDFSIVVDRQSQSDETLPRKLLDPAYSSPEIILNEPVSPQTDIYNLGIILWEMLTGKFPFSGYSDPVVVEKHLEENLPPLTTIHPDFNDSLNNVIQRMTEKNPADRYPDVQTMVQAMRSAIGSLSDSFEEIAIPFENVSNPYKGLQPYSESDAELFFGRENSIKVLVERLSKRQLLCIIGPSGSGKSSLIRAGLLPALRKGAIPGSENWYITSMFPGTHPFEELETSLLKLASRSSESLLEQLKQDERGLIRVTKRIFPQGDGELFLLIDQFEELFTLVENEDERRKFIRIVEEAVRDQRSHIHIILVLRADFYDRPLSYQIFGELLHNNTTVILPPGTEELEDVISSPAESVGVKVDKNLLATIIADVQNQPGALPLLQYTLTELFNIRENNRMTVSKYKSIGGVSGSLSKRAEEIFQSLDPPLQTITKQLFLRLVNITEAPEETRRRALRSELLSMRLNEEEFSSDSLNRVINQFGEFRLLTFDHRAGSREPTVEIAHEALLSEWPRLKTWVDQSRDDLYQQRRLNSLASEWVKTNKSPDYLLRGGRLDHYLHWASNSNLSLTDNETDLLEVSFAARKERREAEEKRRQLDLETAQNLAETQAKRAEEQETASKILKKRAYYLVGALGIAALLAILAIIFGVQASRNSIRAAAQTNLATSRELAMAALNEIEIDPERSALLAIQALSTSHTIEAEEALHQAVQNMRILQRFKGHQAYLNDITYNMDGSRLATTSGDNTAKIWDRKTGEVLFSISSGNAEFHSIIYHPKKPIIVTGDSSGFVRTWDSETGEELDSFSLTMVRNSEGQVVEGSGDEVSVTGIAISPDGNRLAGGNFGGTIKIWDLTSGGEILLPEKPQLTSLAFHPDGNHLAIANGFYPGFVSLVEIPSKEQIFTAEAGNAVSDLAFNPDGISLVSTGLDGNLILWDPFNGEILTNKTFSGEIYTPEFSPDGHQLIVAHPNGTGILLDAGTLDEVLTLSGHTGGVNSVAYSPDGEHVATASQDGTALEWSLKPGYEILTIEGKEGFLRVAYHPSGKQLATTSLTGKVSVWDAKNGDLVWQQERGHDEFAGGLSYSSNGKFLASSSDVPPVIIIWDAVTGERLLTLEGHSDYVNNVTFSPDNQYLASASQDNTVRIWDMDGRQVGLIKHPSSVWGIAFDPGGDILATSPWDDNRATLDVSEESEVDGEVIPDERMVGWDFHTGEQVMNLGPHFAAVRDIAFSSDGNRLAAGTWEGTVTIWNIDTGEQSITFDAFNHTVFRLVFNPDDTQIATSGELVILWDASTGNKLLTFEDYTDPVYDIAYSPDGKYLATASTDGTIRIRALELDDLIELAKKRLTRGWTEDECKRFLHYENCDPIEYEISNN